MNDPDENRRFQIHYGMDDGYGYVVTDIEQTGHDWRGLIVFKTDSRSDAEAKANELNGSD
jgi:hypothetical protein